MTRRAFGSITRLGVNHYRIDYEHGRRADGSRNRRSKTIHGSERDAERLLARLTMEAGATTADTSMTLGAYLDDMWLPHIKGRVRTLTYDGYVCHLGRVKPLRSRRLDKLDAFSIDRWLTSLPGAQSTKQQTFRVLNAALNQAVKWRVIPHNPADAVDRPKVEQTPPDVLSADEVADYLVAFEGHEIEPAVLLALGCGLRRSEIAALDWSDIDFDAGTVSIAKGMHQRGGKVWLEAPKTNLSRRVVSIPPTVLARLRFLRRFGALVSRDGTRVPPLGIKDAYRAHINAQGDSLRYVPLRNLRHTHFSLLNASGIDLKTIQARGGWSNISTPMTYYITTGRTADDLAAAAFDTRAASRGNAASRGKETSA